MDVGDVFDDAATRAMGFAFERACHSLGLADRSDPLTKLVAQKIIAAARDGERDPDKLHEAVLRWAAAPSEKSA
jgi:hypothetical protein